MTPGFGNETVVTALRRNQSMPFDCASLLTAVGLERVSIGPPIKTMEGGECGSPRASIKETAASTGTEGWQTAMMWVSPPRKCSIAMM